MSATLPSDDSDRKTPPPRKSTQMNPVSVTQTETLMPRVMDGCNAVKDQRTNTQMCWKKTGFDFQKSEHLRNSRQ